MTRELFRQLRYWFLGGLILLVGTIIFRWDNGKYDKAVTEAFYDRDAPLGDRFPIGDQQPWQFFNEYNDYFTYFIVGFFLILLILGWWKRDRFQFLVRYSLFAILTIALGAGLLVNNIFKDLWGRPRPAMTDLWPNGGTIIGRFYMVWEPAFLDDPALIGEGVAFPSGHVAIIAAFIVFFYVFMHPYLWVSLCKMKPQKNWIFQGIKWGSLVFTFIVGILTGIGRISLGRHHASDVLWAFGIVFFFTALMYYHIFRIPQFEQKLMAQ